MSDDKKDKEPGTDASRQGTGSVSKNEPLSADAVFKQYVAKCDAEKKALKDLYDPDGLTQEQKTIRDFIVRPQIGAGKRLTQDVPTFLEQLASKEADPMEKAKLQLEARAIRQCTAWTREGESNNETYHSDAFNEAMKDMLMTASLQKDKILGGFNTPQLCASFGLQPGVERNLRPSRAGRVQPPGGPLNDLAREAARQAASNKRTREDDDAAARSAKRPKHGKDEKEEPSEEEKEQKHNKRREEERLDMDMDTEPDHPPAPRQPAVEREEKKGRKRGTGKTSNPVSDADFDRLMQNTNIGPGMVITYTWKGSVYEAVIIDCKEHKKKGNWKAVQVVFIRDQGAQFNQKLHRCPAERLRALRYYWALALVEQAKQQGSGSGSTKPMWLQESMSLAYQRNMPVEIARNFYPELRCEFPGVPNIKIKPIMLCPKFYQLFSQAKTQLQQDKTFSQEHLLHQYRSAQPVFAEVGQGLDDDVLDVET